MTFQTVFKTDKEFEEFKTWTLGILHDENAKDLSRMDATDPKYDRLMLTADRIKGIASDISNVASLP